MDTLERLVVNAETLLREGYYDVRGETLRSPSFLGALAASARSSDVIAEIKFASPGMRSPRDVAEFDAILNGIVAAKPLGLSVLAEPKIFGGSVDFVSRAARTGLPVLMKDVVIDSRQIDAAARCGASALLLIETLARGGHSHRRIDRLIDEAMIERSKSYSRSTRLRSGMRRSRHRPISWGSTIAALRPWQLTWGRHHAFSGSGGRIDPSSP